MRHMRRRIHVSYEEEDTVCVSACGTVCVSMCGKLDPRKHRNNAMRCVLVGEERDGEVMQL